MGILADKLKEYFANTPREQILKDWESVAEFDNVGPTEIDMPDLTTSVTHRIETRNGQQCIVCLHCGLPSFNPGDIKNLWCENCQIFHDYPKELKEQIINKLKPTVWRQVK
jgi:hypothetical protein